MLNKTKNLLILGLLFALLLFLPTIVNAASELPEAQNNVITLEEDVTLSSTYTVDSTLTIDLAGYTLTIPTVNVTGNLTIKDSGNGGNLVISSSEGNITVEGSSAKFTLESGTITNDYYYGVYSLDSGAVVINGGTINTLESCLAGNNTTEKNIFTVNGGTLNATQGPAIYMPGQGSLTITGGTLNGGISVRMGTVNISGGTINATTGDIDSYEYYYGFSGSSWLSDAIFVLAGTYTSSTGDNSLTLNITGGTFNAKNSTGAAFTVYDLGKVKQAVSINISGGTFSTNATDTSAYQIIKYGDFTPTNTYSGDWGTYSGNISTSITGGTYSSDITSTYLTSGYMTVANSNGTYTVGAKATALTITESLYIVTGNTASLDTTVTPSNTIQTVSYSSSDESVATVNSNGTVTGVSAGSATITVTVGDITKTCAVIVTDEGNITSSVQSLDTSDTSTIQAGISDEDKAEVQAILVNSAASLKEVQALIDEGKEITVEIVIDIVDESAISSDDADSVVAFIGDDNFVQYLDISVIVNADGEYVTDLTELSDEITISILLTDDLLVDGRTFYIVRIHDGVAEKISTSLDGNTLTFKTDKFSTYALAYTDSTEEDTATTTSTDDSTTTSTDDSEIVQTSDYIYLAVGMLLFIVLVNIAIKKRK